MKYSNEQIQILLTKSFNYLVAEYALDMVENKVNENGITQIYKGQEVAIAINFEFREAYVNILIHRLVNNEIVRDDYPYKKNVSLNNIGLDYIVKFNNPKDLTKPLYDETSDYYGKENAFEILVQRLSANLKKYGAPLLDGDFKIFNEIDSFVKKHYG